MPLDRLVMLLMVVISAAGVTIFLVAFVFAAIAAPRLSAAAIPIALLGYVIWRVIAGRLASREDTHYDNIDP